MWPWSTRPHLHLHVCVSMCVPHSGCSPTHSSLGWPPLNPSPVRCCCLAAGLNTAHCVSAPSQPQTVPTNVLLIRWLNYSCKNNVDISLKIAVCQILLADFGLQPLLSNSLSDPPHPPTLPQPLLPPLPSSLPQFGSSHTFPHPCDFFAPLHIFFTLSCNKLQHRQTLRGQIFHK